MSYKVQQITIPHLKGDFLTDLREVRFENEKDITYLVLDCIDGGADLQLDDKVEVKVVSMKDCNPMSLTKEGWAFYPDYLCVSAHRDGNNHYIYDFYKKKEKENDPYSQAFMRLKGFLNVGDSYVFCYKKVK